MADGAGETLMVTSEALWPLGRAGRYVGSDRQGGAYLPAMLPPQPSIAFDHNLRGLQVAAAEALGRLRGVLETIPAAADVGAMLRRCEACASARIAGVPVGLIDLLDAESTDVAAPATRHVPVARGLVRALEYLNRRDAEAPVSREVLSVVHSIVVGALGGRADFPGAYRSASAGNAAPAREVPRLVENLASYAQAADVPSGVRAGVALAQIGLIAPFARANGRLARAFAWRLVVGECGPATVGPPISAYLASDSDTWEARRQRLRDGGGWEDWIRHWLSAVAGAADAAADAAREAQLLIESHRTRVASRIRVNGRALRLAATLPERPVIAARDVVEHVGVALPTASRLLRRFVSLGLLVEVTGKQRYRRYRYRPYIELFGSCLGPRATESRAAVGGDLLGAGV